MIIPVAVVDAYGDEIKAVNASAASAVARVIRALDWDGPQEILEANRDAVASALAEIVYRHGAAAAGSASEFFELVSEVANPKRPDMAEAIFDASMEALNGTVHYAAGSLFGEDGPDVEAFERRCQEAVTRSVTDCFNRTMQASGPDEIMYKRETNDGHPCRMCEEWASLGFVWTSDEMIELHDGCMCFLVPGYGDTRIDRDDDTLPAPLYPDIEF